MPTHKDLKRLTRSRMQKTGESYTTARARLIDKKARASAPPDLSKLAGMSDDAIQAKTGRRWEEWVRALDAKNATTMSHRDIAGYVHDAFDLSGWWAQTVTVGYERIRGLRDIGQRRGGAYEANKSRTFGVPVAKLYRAFSVARTRRRWLPDVDVTVRTSTKEKSMRLAWHDGTLVAVYFTAKGARKSQVAIQHSGLSKRADSEKAKAYWAERLAALSSILESAL